MVHLHGQLTMTNCSLKLSDKILIHLLLNKHLNKGKAWYSHQFFYFLEQIWVFFILKIMLLKSPVK